MVVAAALFALTLAMLLQGESAATKALLIEQFHLPTDAEFLEYSARRGSVEAIVQLTPAQYASYARDLDGWTFTSFQHGRRTVEAVTEPGWNRWWKGDSAVLVDLDASPTAPASGRSAPG